MEYSFEGEITSELQQRISKWVTERWKQMEGQPPDQDFLQYVEFMIGNRKSMKEISIEFHDLGIEEETAGKLAMDLGQFLSTESPSKIISAPVISPPVISQSSPLLGPLKTSRSGNFSNISNSTASNGNYDDTSDKLLAPLPTSRFTKSTGSNISSNNGSNRNKQTISNEWTGKRGRLDSSQVHGIYKKMKSPDQEVRADPFYSKRRGEQATASSTQEAQNNASVGLSAAPLVETVKYFEEMNKVAKESGFKNAQEMLNSQKEMMALMASATGAGGGISSLSAATATAAGMSQASLHDIPGAGRGFDPFAGRGRGFRGRGRGQFSGRGRGRWPDPYEAEAGQTTTTDIPATAEAVQSDAVHGAVAATNEAGAEMVWGEHNSGAMQYEDGSSWGRGRGRGRGWGSSSWYRGRGRAARGSYFTGDQDDPAQFADPTAAAVAATAGSSSGYPFAGHGGGRNPFFVPSGGEENKEGGEAVGGVPTAGYEGRGRGRGRRGPFNPFHAAANGPAMGGFGSARGSMNKVWVRDPTVDSALASGR